MGSEATPTTPTPTSTPCSSAKISGYLEKKGKLRVVTGWKKYWFVLEGRLLLYYRSKEEYEAISPCKGSVSLGPPCSIKPTMAATCIFQIETRSNTIVLRAENRSEQDRWMHGILLALNMHNNSAPAARRSHFRYSADDLAPSPKAIGNGTRESAGGAVVVASDGGAIHNDNSDGTDTVNQAKPKKEISQIFSRQNTMPNRPNSKPASPVEEIYSERLHHHHHKQIDADHEHHHQQPSPDKVIEKLRRMGARSYVAGSLNDISRPSCKSSPKLPKSEKLQRMIINTSVHSLDNDDDECAIYTESERDEYAYAKTRSQNQQDQNRNSIVNDGTSGSEAQYDTCTYLRPTIVDCNDQEDPYSAVPSLPPRFRSASQENLRSLKGPGPANLKKKSGTFRKITTLMDPGTDKEQRPRNKVSRKRSFMDRMLRKNKAKDDNDSVSNLNGVNVSGNGIAKRIPEINSLRDAVQVLKNSRENVYQRNESVQVNMSEDEDAQVSNKCTRRPPSEVKQCEESPYYQPTFPKDYRPELPPRQKLTDNYYIQSPLTPLPDEPFYIPRLKLKRPRSIQKIEKMKTIDEILDDLDRETRLLKVIENSDETKLRLIPNVVSASMEHLRYSDDLNSLLEELTKVTCAPVLNTNATSSLIYRPDTFSEWGDLIPIRKRRYSDPDYDVPRPHDIKLIIKTEDDNNNALDINEKRNKVNADPCSLQHISSQTTEPAHISYQSHHYMHVPELLKPLGFSSRRLFASDTDIISIENITNECIHTKMNKERELSRSIGELNMIVKATCPQAEDEVFVDSLEPYEGQATTEF